MILNDILEGAGFVNEKTYRQTRFVTAPRETYCTWDVNESYRGTDDFEIVIKQSDFSIDLYQSEPDERPEMRIEKQLILHELPFTKSTRDFIQAEKLYQTTYEFTFLEKVKGENK